ncbi:hypothetical protein [Leptospira noguchii]|uniref:hypothetical protein n=1 Tax=Leptospira noguchii TaxID=28182 RepID=UPI001F41CB4A|nr:hypothetical protein [Leptospira noguchii]UOG59044.1 hypothetical protein MAL07_09345 [Leptospira noguchii]
MEHILGMLAAGDTSETILEGYPVVRIGRHPSACLVYAYRMIGHERIENIPKETALTEIYTKNIMTPPTLNNVAANMPTRRTNSWSY